MNQETLISVLQSPQGHSRHEVLEGIHNSIFNKINELEQHHGKDMTLAKALAIESLDYFLQEVAPQLCLQLDDKANLAQLTGDVLTPEQLATELTKLRKYINFANFFTASELLKLAVVAIDWLLAHADVLKLIAPWTDKVKLVELLSKLFELFKKGETNGIP